MKKAILFIHIIFLNCIFLYSQAPDWSWVEQAGGSALDYAKGIAVDQSKNIIITGYFQGTSFFDGVELSSNGSNDIFIAKYDPNFNLLWAKNAGGSQFDFATDVVVDTDGNSYLTGTFRSSATFGDSILTGLGSSNIFLAKYDANGNLLWVEQAGGSDNNAGQDLVIDNNGDILVSGFFKATITFGDTLITGNASLNIFVAKYGSDGNLLWVEQAGGDSDDAANAITVDNSDNVYLTGRISGASEFPDTTFLNPNVSNIFIAKYTTNGDFLWAIEAGGGDIDMGWSIAIDKDGNNVTTGQFNALATFGDSSLTSFGSSDVFICKYDADGNFMWVEQEGGNGADLGTDIKINQNNEITLLGYFSETATFQDEIHTSSGSTDIFVARYNNDGNLIWFRQGGGTDTETGDAIAIDKNDDIYATGYFKETATFGTFNVTSSGSFEVYIAKIGNPVSNLKQLNNKPKQFYLKQNYPNPFNPRTTIEYFLQKSTDVTLIVYNIVGQQVKTLVKQNQNPGLYFVQWDGTNELGIPVSSGIYIYRIKTGQFIQNREMILLK